MKAALSVLRTELEDLRKHIEMMGIEWDLLGATSASPPCSTSDEIAMRFREHVGKGLAKRRFDYNCIIISLYGALEHYIEEVAREYVLGLNSIVPTYVQLPPDLITSHLMLTCQLIQKAEHSKFRGSVDAASLVANLHSCLNNQTPYRVNAEALCEHTANFRVEFIDSLFRRLGVQEVARRLRKFPTFSQYLGKKWPTPDAAWLKDEELRATLWYLDDLAERRNEVAHGSVSELLSNELLLDYVEFVEAFCGGVYEVLE